MAKQKRGRSWSENGCSFDRYPGRGNSHTYHVRTPHPFQGFGHSADSQTDDPDKALAFAAEQMKLDAQVASLIDEDAVEEEFEQRNRILSRVCGYGADVKKRVHERWRQTIESFGIDPSSAVQVVPVRFQETSQRTLGEGPLKGMRLSVERAPIAYWTSRKTAAEILKDPQEKFDRLSSEYHEKTYYGPGWATCDETSSWGTGRLKGVMETTWQLAKARKDVDRLAAVFLRGSNIEYSSEFWYVENRSSENERRICVDVDLQRVIVGRAGLMDGPGSWHSNTTRLFPTIYVGETEQHYGVEYRRADHRVKRTHERGSRGEIQVESLDELIEFFAIQHARIIGQHVVLLYVDESNPDPDLSSRHAYGSEAVSQLEDDEAADHESKLEHEQFSDEDVRQNIRARMFDGLRRQLTPHQIRQRAAKRPKAPKVSPVREASIEEVLPPQPVPFVPFPPREKAQPMAKTYTYLENLKARKAAEKAAEAENKPEEP